MKDKLQILAVCLVFGFSTKYAIKLADKWWGHA